MPDEFAVLSFLRVSLSEPRQGNICWWMSHGKELHRLDVVTLPTSFPQLINALDALLEPEAECLVRWTKESSEIQWRFTVEKGGVSFHLEKEGAGRIWTVAGTYAEVALPFWESMLEMCQPFAKAAIEKRLNCAFPFDALNRLTEKLRAMEVIGPPPLVRPELERFLKPSPIPAAAVMKLRQVTQAGVLDCKSVLEEASPFFYALYLASADKAIANGLHGFYDPLEDDPEFARLLESVSLEAHGFCVPILSSSLSFIWDVIPPLMYQEIVEAAPDFFDAGSEGLRQSEVRDCRVATTKRILREKHGIVWIPSQELNKWLIGSISSQR